MVADVFVLERSLEIDIEISDDVETFRVEILRARLRPERFRGRLWRVTMVRAVASFPQDDEGEPTESFDADQLEGADELLGRDYTSFEAASIDDAEAQVLADLRQRVMAITWSKR